MSFKRSFLVLFLAFLIAGCVDKPEPALVVSVPDQPEVVRVGFTPALAQYSETLQACAVEVAVLMEELPWPRLQEEDYDVMLVFGEKEKNLSDQVYQLGQAQIVFIVHPELPYDALSLTHLRDIYHGTMTDWSEVAVTSSYAGIIQPWGYMEETEIMTSILTMLDVTETSGQWFVVPGPAEMVEQVSQAPNAIGIVPAFAVTDDVRVLTTADEVSPNIPILAIWSVEPSDIQQNWLLCVQEAMQ